MDYIASLIAQANATIESAANDTSSNGTSAGTVKFVSTTEGMITAYCSIATMAFLPIVIGSFKSVQHQIRQQIEVERTGQPAERMTSKDAMMFPLIASCGLLGLYLLFWEYINMLMTGYFVILGALAMTNVIAPLMRAIVPAALVGKANHHLKLTKSEEQKEEILIDFTFDTNDVVSFIVSSVLAVWYLLQKHWVANNIFGVAFAINGIELLQLSSVSTGCILLGGLFFYDIFWVFGTDVMVTVAKSFDAPIKLVFPQDFLEKGIFGTNFTMLGLGDIVIPGIFIALLLRFDKSLNRGTNLYFNSSFLAYILGLSTTFVVLVVFKHAQPALLYLVPYCISFPLTVALIKGDLKAMFAYEDHPNTEGENEPATSDRVTRSASKKEE